jgi:hypothetical protein
LNVVATPHPAGVYEDLFRTALAKKVIASYRGSRRAILGSFGSRGMLVQAPAYGGKVMTFTRLDTEQPWLDLDQAVPATDDAIASINIPEGLHPEMAEIEYVFMGSPHHRVIVDISRAGITACQKVFQQILGDPSVLKAVKDNYELRDLSVAVHVQQSREGLERIFAMRRLSYLRIVVAIPNPDDTGDASETIADRLHRLRARQAEQIFKAQHGTDGIIPDEKMKKDAAAALTTGSVAAKGLEGEAERQSTLSTTDQPERLSVQAEDGVALGEVLAAQGDTLKRLVAKDG